MSRQFTTSPWQLPHPWPRDCQRSNSLPHRCAWIQRSTGASLCIHKGKQPHNAFTLPWKPWHLGPLQCTSQPPPSPTLHFPSCPSPTPCGALTWQQFPSAPFWPRSLQSDWRACHLSGLDHHIATAHSYTALRHHPLWPKQHSMLAQIPGGTVPAEVAARPWGWGAYHEDLAAQPCHQWGERMASARWATLAAHQAGDQAGCQGASGAWGRTGSPLWHHRPHGDKG